MTKIEFIHLYGGNFRRHFVWLSFARRPRKKCDEMAFDYFDRSNPITGKGTTTVS